MLFAVGIALKALSQGSGATDAFHRMRYASAAENIGVAALYGVLLLQEQARGQRSRGRRRPCSIGRISVRRRALPLSGDGS